MTATQLQRRTELDALWSFEPHSLKRSFSETLDQIAKEYPPDHGWPLILYTDEKYDYSRAFYEHSLYTQQDSEHLCVHYKINSQEHRTKNNPLFPCNYIDRELRKNQAAHHRETACHTRNVNNGMLRHWCYIGWHNYWKKARIKAPVQDNCCHAELAGICPWLIEVMKENFYRWRFFLSRVDLTLCDRRAWLLEHRTPLKAKNDKKAAYVSA